MLGDLERLIELQEIETRSGAAAKAIAEAPGRIAALESLLKSATAELDSARQHLAANKAARGMIDKDLIAVQQRQSKYKEQLMQVKTNDEFRAMQHQIEAAGVEIGQQEERTLVNMMEADEVNAAIKKAEAGLKAAQAKMNAEKSIIEKDVETSKTIVADCAARRAKLVATMDNKGVVETFERIAKVRGTAIARAEGERCTVCQVRLRPVVYQSVIRNEAIVQCDSCQRILYFVAPKAPQAPEAR